MGGRNTEVGLGVGYATKVEVGVGGQHERSISSPKPCPLPSAAKPTVRLQNRLRIYGRPHHHSFPEECKVTGFPPPNITWYHNGSALKHRDYFGSIDLEEPVTDKLSHAVVSRLWVVGVEKFHGGNYMWGSEHDVAKQRHYARLLGRYAQTE